MVKRSAMAMESGSIARGNRSSARKTKPKSKILQGQVSKKVSCLGNCKTAKLKGEAVSASKKSKKNSLKPKVGVKKQVKFQNGTRNFTAGKQSQISKLNRNKAGSAKITRNELSSKKILKKLSGEEVTTSISSRKCCQPKILKRKRSIAKVKLLKIVKISSPANTLENGLQEAVQKVRKKRNNCKPNSVKLKATIDKTEVLNNNGEWSTFEELVKENTETNNTDNINETVRVSSCAKTTAMQCKVKNNNFVNSALEVQNIVHEDLDISEEDKGQKRTEIEVQPKPKVTKCSTADAILQNVNKNIQQVTKMASNIKETPDKQNKPKVEVTAKAAMARSNDFPLKDDEVTSAVGIKDCIDKSRTNSAVEKPLPKCNQREKSIKKKKRISKKKLSEKFIVKIKKTKLSTNILGKLGKKATNASMGDCSSKLSSKESSDAGTNAASTCSFSHNRPEKSSYSYLDSKNINKRRHSGKAHKRKTGSEFSQIGDEMLDQNGEYTQDEDDNEEVAVQAVRKKRKYRSKQLAKRAVEETDMAKRKRLAGYDQTIDDVIKQDSELSEKTCKNEKSKMIYEHMVVTKNMSFIEDTEDVKITKNRLPQIETIANVKRKYREKITEEKHKKNYTYMQNMRKKTCTKTPVVLLENLFLDKNLVRKYNLKRVKKCKSTKDRKLPIKTHRYSKLSSNSNCSVSSNTVSPLLKDSTPSSSMNPSKLNITPAAVSEGEFSCKNNSNYGGISTIRITCNVAENQAVVSCVPISNKNMPLNKICDNANAPLHHAPISNDSQDDNYQDADYQDDNCQDDDYQDDNYQDAAYQDDNYQDDDYQDDNYQYDDYQNDDYQNDDPQNDDTHDENIRSFFHWKWTEIYEFSVIDTITIDSYDGIFENAEFSFKVDSDITKEDRDLKSVPIKKPHIPLIIRTVDNNYANKNVTSWLHDVANSLQEDVSNKSDGSRVQSPTDSKTSRQTTFTENCSNSDSGIPKLTVTHSNARARPEQKLHVSNESGRISITINSNTSTAAVNDANIPAFTDSTQATLTPTAIQNADAKLSINSGQTRKSVFSRLDTPKKLQFKVPFLPPAKRPPTHLESKLQKHLVSGSLMSPAPKIQGETNVVSENDDALSIFASSIGSATNLDEELAVDDVLQDNANAIFDQEDEEPTEETCPQIIKIPTPVVVTDVNRSPEKSLVLTNSHNLENNVTRWMAKNLSAPDQLQVKVSSTPFIFRRICLYHFTRKNGCAFNPCRNIHDPGMVGNPIMNLPYDKLIEAYAYAKNYCKLYTTTFHYFVSAFEKLKCTNILMQFVDDILRIEIYNKTPFIEKLVTSLCNIGVPFIDVVQEILMFADGGKNVCLLDILLDIVCIRHKQNLYNNWCIVQQLIKHRTEPIDCGLVEEIMTMCSQQSNAKLAVNVVQDFIVPKMVDLKAINIHTLNNFLSTLECDRLEEGQTLRARMELDGILIIPPLMRSSSLVSAESAHGSNKPYEMPMVSNKSNLLNASEKRSSPLNDGTGFMPHKVTAVQKRSSYSNPSHESNAISPNNNQFELDFYGNFENVASVSKNSKHQSDSSNQNVSTKYVTNTESHNDHEIELACDNYNSRRIYTPSPAFSATNDILVSQPSSASSDQDIDSNFGLNIPNCNILSRDSTSQDVVPSRSATSVEGSTKSKHTIYLGRRNVDNLESRNNEFEFNFNQDGNLSPSNSMNGIPVHTLDDNEVIGKSDLLLLKKIAERGNNLEFFMMLGRFKDTTLSRAFILNTLVYYKVKTPKDIYEMFFPIVTGMAYLDPALKNDNSLMSMLNVLVANILGLLENHQAYDKASDILLQFHGHYEKLCNSTWFMGPHRYNYSEIGKYIYLCKILVKSHHLKQAWEILTIPELKLLYGINKWVLKHCDCFDNKLRNYVLADLINTAIDIDIRFAKDVILSLINDNNIITEIDIWKFFNQLLLKLIDHYEYIQDLTNMIENIIEGWYKNLFPSVMRGLLVRLALDIPENDALELYDKCCRRKCYPYIRGDENTLYFTTNMVEVEIYMTLHVYIYKKVRNNFPLRSIILRMGLPDPAHQQPQILSNSHCSSHDLKLKIANVLAKGLPFTVCIDYSNTEDQYIAIQAAQLQLMFSYYRKLSQSK